eukprot:Gregarina_sp_Poly_1__1894@NODE_1494_length_4002_cov_410_358831_g990_i0_p2_GENE_NODE_1494_length_4002_cov_410_358831_g990_i0NODE_1494_length_4002_cov_410_358831_g990_i0_p2_ORF_typecomplete_len421_score57_44Glyco_transf_25/PF01755_17/5_5e08_NODE_1494_length_4002_cov_410_358831_g990_i023553617
MLALPVLPRRQRRAYVTRYPIFFINLPEHFERRALLKLHFPDAQIFEAVSIATLIDRGPASLREQAIKIGNSTRAAFAYAAEHRASVGAVCLTVGHCQVLELLETLEFPVGIVLEDDAAAFIWGLSPIGNLDKFLESHLEFRNVLFMQRLIDPRQYPPFRRKRFLTDILTKFRPRDAVSLYTTERGLGGTTALAWSRPGWRQFLDRHRDGFSQDGSSAAYGCPKDGSDCALDFDLKSFPGTASLMPPIVGVRLSTRSSIERLSNPIVDQWRHLQAEVTAMDCALSLFEALSLLTAINHRDLFPSNTVVSSKDQWETSFRTLRRLSLFTESAKALNSKSPKRRIDFQSEILLPQWRVQFFPMNWVDRFIDNDEHLVSVLSFIGFASVCLLWFILRRLCLCSRKSSRKRSKCSSVVVEMKSD